MNVTMEEMLRSTGHDPAKCAWCLAVKDMPAQTAAQVTKLTAEKARKDAEAAKQKADLAAKNALLDKQYAERVFMSRATSIVESILNSMPTTTNGVAGWLQAKGARGDKAGATNALAQFLRREVAAQVVTYAYKPTADTFYVFVEENGLLIETPRYQMSITPREWQYSFMRMLRDDEYPALMTP